jgi:hypothetical protein
MTEEFNSREWKCNRCGKWNAIRKIFRNGEYYKTCKCGRTMIITVEIKKIEKRIPKITNLRDCYRRCDRGTMIRK